MVLRSIVFGGTFRDSVVPRDFQFIASSLGKKLQAPEGVRSLVSVKPALLDAARRNKLPTESGAVKSGDFLVGYVKNKVDYGVFVSVRWPAVLVRVLDRQAFCGKIAKNTTRLVKGLRGTLPHRTMSNTPFLI